MDGRKGHMAFQRLFHPHMNAQCMPYSPSVDQGPGVVLRHGLARLKRPVDESVPRFNIVSCVQALRR